MIVNRPSADPSYPPAGYQSDSPAQAERPALGSGDFPLSRRASVSSVSSDATLVEGQPGAQPRRHRLSNESALETLMRQDPAHFHDQKAGLIASMPRDQNGVLDQAGMANRRPSDASRPVAPEPRIPSAAKPASSVEAAPRKPPKEATIAKQSTWGDFGKFLGKSIGDSFSKKLGSLKSLVKDLTTPDDDPLRKRSENHKKKFAVDGHRHVGQTADQSYAERKR